MKTVIAFLILTTSSMAADKDQECAAQAEKAVTKYGGELILSRYSPKYQRCYLLEAFVVGETKHVRLLFADALVEEKTGAVLAIMSFAFLPDGPGLFYKVFEPPLHSLDCDASASIHRRALAKLNGKGHTNENVR